MSIQERHFKVSANGRYFVDQDDRPFFYLADTVWTLFKRLDRSEAEEYLQNRASKGFTVIQAYLLRGLEAPNRDGEVTLLGRDPTQLNEAFFENVDFIVNRANDLNLVMGIVVSYGEHVIQAKLDEQIFDEANAFEFGKILGERYRGNAVMWLLGGDRKPLEGIEIWKAMGRGLKKGSRGAHLVSYHGPGGTSSSTWFHQEEWLDFNTIQSGHRWAVPNYTFVRDDARLAPPKPTLDMEARYENHPDGANTERRMDAHQEREAAYWAVFAGAAGHGYGCNDMWQLYDPERLPSGIDKQYFPWDRLMGNTHWRDAMDFRGAYGMGHMRRLVQERWYRMRPDLEVLASPQGEGEDHVEASIADDGSFILAYLPFGNPVAICMDRLSGSKVNARWYDPREGVWLEIETHSPSGTQMFTPPSRGPQNDWVLVLDAV